MKELGQDECIVFGDWSYGAMSCVPFTGGEGTNQVCAKVVPSRDGRGEHEGGEEVMPSGLCEEAAAAWTPGHVSTVRSSQAARLQRVLICRSRNFVEAPHPAS